MSMQVETERAATVAQTLELQAGTATWFETVVAGVGERMGVAAWCSPAATIAAEIADEVGTTARILRLRVEMAGAADAGWTLARYEAAERDLAAATAALTEGLDDGVGATGSDADRQRLLVVEVLGEDAPHTAPSVLLDPAAWEAEHVTGAVLDAAAPEQAAEYWNMLSEEQQYAAIVLSTPAVSDRYIGGVIELDEVQVFALQAQPLPWVLTRGPRSGPGTDWAGVPLPVIVPAADSGDHDRTPADASDVRPTLELRSFAGDTVVCSLIQVWSPIPSRPGTDPVDGTISAGGVVRDVSRLSTPFSGAKAINPATWLAAFADIGLCRLGVGSGAPISTDRVVTDEGEVVYAGSGSPDQPYMDRNGLPLSPDRRVRDEQMWRAEHNLEKGNWAPYPGYPAFEVNAGA